MHRAGADAGRARERSRQHRLLRIAVWLTAVGAWLWYRVLTGQPLLPQLPSVDPFLAMTGAFFLLLVLAMVGTTMGTGRSPHVVFRPEQIDVRLQDVKGLAPVREDVQRSLDVFLSAATFRREMGGAPRRGLLFEGPPGTGKTHLAKAMAAEAGVPFLFVSATSFQSMYYGATARKIRAYFRALRRAARSEGAAIGFIEEIDAIGLARGAMAAAVPATSQQPAVGTDCGGLVGLASVAGTGPVPAVQTHPAGISESTGGVLNELLVQLQSFDQPTGGQRVQAWAVDLVNSVLPAHRQLPRPRPRPVDVLVIAATNRADALDPALLRPGRFDRRLVFGLPDKAGRRELVDHFLATKAHEQELAGSEHRDALAGVTQGYSPVMIERLLDEALVNALKRGAKGMSWADVEQARLVTEIGLGQPVGYTPHEERLIATHEAGHAVTAWLAAPHRRLEILTIVRRNGALGLLAHGDREDVYTRSRAELEGHLQIAFGGQVAEEIFFGDVSTGPGGDLAHATAVAAAMVGQAGMADTLVSFSAVDGAAGNLVAKVLGDQQGREMVDRVLRRAKERTRGVLAANRDLVAALRDALLERHELIGSEITEVLQAAKAARAVPARVGLAPERVEHGLLGGPATPRPERSGGRYDTRSPFRQDQSLPPHLR